MHTLGERLGLRLDEHQREIQVAGEWQTAALEQQMQAIRSVLEQHAQTFAREIETQTTQHTTLAQQVQGIVEHLDVIRVEGDQVAERLTLVEQAVAHQKQAATATAAQEQQASQQQMERLTRDLQQLSARVLAFQTQQNQDRSHEGHEGGD
jgi:regulator of replication initiation timing